MDNQHKKISGYRDLTQEEIDTMNEIKALAEQCRVLFEQVMEAEGADKRAAAIARTDLQTGFMWLTRAIAKPGTF